MRTPAEFWRTLRALRHRSELETGLDDEIRFHIDKQTEKNRRGGMAPEEARRQAMIQFGALQNAKESVRDEIRAPIVEILWRDLRYAARALRRAPGFTIAATLTLALGIGAATAVFSVVNGVLLKPLPYPDPDSLVAVWHRVPGMNVPGDVEVSPAQFFTYRDETRALQEFGLWASGRATVSGRPETDHVESLLVTHGTLQALAVPPAIGRWFSREDDASGSPETVVLTYGYWQRRFGEDPFVVGQQITVDARPRTVIGIMPRDFEFLTLRPEVILPLRFDRDTVVLGQFNYQGVARLRPGVTLADANADVARMVPIFLKSWPPPRGVSRQQLESARLTPALHPLKEDVIGEVGDVLWMIMATGGFVLLLACTSVAGLFLVRMQGRQLEMATRMALGAGWSRIARAALLEHVALATASGVLGIAISLAAIRLIVTVAPANLPRVHHIGIDGAPLVFAFVATLLCGPLVALFSIIRSACPDVALSIGGGRGAMHGAKTQRIRNVLVAAQVALALVLLVGSGLMARTFLALHAVDAGFTEPDTIQTFRVAIPSTEIADSERALRLQHDILNRLASIPGVRAASFANSAPLEPFAGGDVLIAEDRTYRDGEIPPVRRFKFVAPGFFTAVGTRLVAGRDFTWTDLYERRPVAVVSESVARDIWQDPRAAIGKRVRENPANRWREIVGVAADVRDDGIHLPARPIVYWPALVDGFGRSGSTQLARLVTFVARSDRAGLQDFVGEVRQAVRDAQPNVPMWQVRTLGALYDESMAITVLALVTLGTGAAMALLLGVVGIYGVIAYMVAQRTREIGVRIALGADHLQVAGTFLRHGVAVAAAGVGCGLTLAVGFSELMSSLLYGVTPLDSLTYAIVVIVVLAASALATYVPARRATRIDPIDALRSGA